MARHMCTACHVTDRRIRLQNGYTIPAHEVAQHKTVRVEYGGGNILKETTVEYPLLKVVQDAANTRELEPLYGRKGARIVSAQIRSACTDTTCLDAGIIPYLKDATTTPHVHIAQV